MLRYRYRNTKKKRPVTNLYNKMRRSIRQYERLEVGESMKSLVNIISKDLILSLFTEHHSGTVGNWVDLHWTIMTSIHRSLYSLNVYLQWYIDSKNLSDELHSTAAFRRALITWLNYFSSLLFWFSLSIECWFSFGTARSYCICFHWVSRWGYVQCHACVK